MSLTDDHVYERLVFSYYMLRVCKLTTENYQFSGGTPLDMAFKHMNTIKLVQFAFKND